MIAVTTPVSFVTLEIDQLSKVFNWIGLYTPGERVTIIDDAFTNSDNL